jgi:hypothetical protein
MKQLILNIAALLGVVAPIVALAEQPPLIDRNLFFGEIAIADAQISPDGRFISFLKPYRGTRNIWVKRTDEPFSAARRRSKDRQRCGDAERGVGAAGKLEIYRTGASVELPLTASSTLE